MFTNINSAEKLAHRYREVGARSGLRRRLGENMCLVRWLHIAPTDAEAQRSLAQGDGELWKNFYNPMGRRQVNLTDAVASALSSGLYSVGSVEHVRDDLIRQWRKAPFEYLILNSHYAQTPLEVVLQTMALYMKHVQPALTEVAESARSAAD